MKNSSLLFIKLIIATLMTFAVIFVGYQLYKYNFVSIKTESAVMGEMEETVDTVGVFFRNEDPLASGGYEYLDVIRAEGERVAAGGTIARVYADEKSAKVRKEIRELEEKIATYEEVLANSGSYQSAATGIDQAIYENLRTIASDAHFGNSKDAIGLSDELLIEIMKKKISTGDLVSYDATLEELQKELSTLKASAGTSLNHIKTKGSGYFSLSTDGLESQFTEEYLDALTVESFDATISMCSDAKKPADEIGKMVYDNSWSVAIKVPTSEINLLETDDTVDIRIPAFRNDRIRCTVVDIRKDGDESLLVLSSSVISDNILTLRAEEICLILKTYSGIQVRKSALRKVDGEDGVYVKVGLLLRYKKVNILFSDGNNALIEYDAMNGSGLRIYDQVVYKGSKLYDGKAVT